MKIQGQTSRPVAGIEGLPPWAGRPSPWGLPWSGIIERREWFEHFHEAPPFREPSPLRLRVLRHRPGDVPRVLLGAGAWPGNLLTSPLARLMDAGPGPLEERLASVKTEDVLAALAGSPLSGTEGKSAAALLSLVSPAADALRPAILDAAGAATRARFGGRVLLYAPLYLSNECTSLCVYCGFRFGNPIRRVTLTKERIGEEAAALARQGTRRVLLLAGDAPRRFGVDDLDEAVRAVAGSFKTVSVEVFPMSTGDYARLVEAGIRGVTLYQETYDIGLYRAVHPGGRKRNLLWRLGALERAAAAGVATIGIGSLLGLGDWRFETVALGLHGRKLLDLFPGLGLTVSFPRLRPIHGGFAPPRPVSDEELCHMMAALRLFLPEAGLVLSTRESPALRDRLAPIVITQMSAGSRTAPGSYAPVSSDEAPGRQFDIEDTRTLLEIEDRLKSLGLDVV